MAVCSTALPLLTLLLIHSVVPFTHQRIKRDENSNTNPSSISLDGTIELFVREKVDGTGQHNDAAPLTEEDKIENHVDESQHSRPGSSARTHESVLPPLPPCDGIEYMFYSF